MDMNDILGALVSALTSAQDICKYMKKAVQRGYTGSLSYKFEQLRDVISDIEQLIDIM